MLYSKSNIVICLFQINFYNFLKFQQLLKHIRDFCKRRFNETTDSEKVLVKKIQDLELKLKNSNFYSQELSLLLKSHNSFNSIGENTENLLRFNNISALNLNFSDYGVLIPYEEIRYQKNKDSRIGRGGFSTVYRAELFGSTWAVKKFSWKFTGEIQSDLLDIKNVLNEISIMNSLHHERILKLQAFAFRLKPKKFSVKMVTELMKSDLRHLLYEEEELKEEDKISIALQILQGIRYLHSRKIQHLDLKPQNILVSESHNIVKIADFGISKANCQETKKTNVLGTTLAYSSREYAIENIVSPQKSDMWSFGAILYELFSKRKPWGECRMDEIRECLYKKEDFLNVSKGSLPEEIREMVQLCMKYSTEDRVSSEDMIKLFPREINGKCLKTVKSKNI